MHFRRVALLFVMLVVVGACGSPSTNDPREDPSMQIRVATYNASLNRATDGELLADLSTGDDPQIRAVAEVIQRNHPDMLLVNEFDYYPDNRAVDLFRDNYLTVAQRGRTAIDYPYAYTAPVNTGVPTGDRSGDTFGFGNFEGQYGMLVLSKYPIDTGTVRTFQNFLWKDMPDNLIPRDYYGEGADILRLSSKSHWDVPVTVENRTVHLLVSHPTPPSFDGPEDRNGRRNHDEVRLSADYITSGDAARYIYDDAGVRGGLTAGSSFVVLGDQNSDPNDGGSLPGTTAQLLDLAQLVDPRPRSDGAAEQADTSHVTPGELNTADFRKPEPGNLRVDYVLPSRDLTVIGSQVFWPASGQEGADLMPPTTTSDHRLVCVDLEV